MNVNSLFSTLLVRSAAVLVVVSLLSAQIGAQAPSGAEPVAAEPSVTIEAGTHIPAVLLTEVRSKGLKPGAPVRARISFPITVGNQLAVPVASYVEGVVEVAPPATKKLKHPQPPLHFTRLVLADGTIVPLDATAVTAGSAQLQEVQRIPAGVQMASASGPSADDPAPEFAWVTYKALQTSTTGVTNPFAHSGPNPGLFIGLGIAVVFTLGLILLARRTTAPKVWYAANWQFDLVLQAPLTVGTAHVNASAAMPAR